MTKPDATGAGHGATLRRGGWIMGGGGLDAACDPCATAIEAHPRYPRVRLVDAARGSERHATVDALLREND